MAGGLTDVHITSVDRDALMSYINTFARGRTDMVLIGEGVTRIDHTPFVVVEFDDGPDEDFLRWLDEETEHIVDVAVFDVILADEAQEVA